MGRLVWVATLTITTASRKALPMQPLSKGFYLGSVIAAQLLGVLLAVVGMALDAAVDRSLAGDVLAWIEATTRQGAIAGGLAHAL